MWEETAITRTNMCPSVCLAVLLLSVPHIIKAFAKFYHRRSVLIVKCYNKFEHIYTTFYGDLIDIFKRIVKQLC